MAEYGSMFAVSGLAAILFFGGWNGPIPITDLLGMSYEPGESWNPVGYLANLLGFFNFMLKTCLFVTLMMWVRWTLPRLRIDQVMTTCLKYCTPLAAAMFLGVVAWTYFLPGGVGLRYQPYAFVPEAKAYVSPAMAAASDNGQSAEAAGAEAEAPADASAKVSATIAPLPGRSAQLLRQAAAENATILAQEGGRGSH